MRLLPTPIECAPMHLGLPKARLRAKRHAHSVRANGKAISWPEGFAEGTFAQVSQGRLAEPVAASQKARAMGQCYPMFVLLLLIV